MGNWIWVFYDEITKYFLYYDMVCINVEKEIYDYLVFNFFKIFFTL